LGYLPIVDREPRNQNFNISIVWSSLAKINNIVVNISIVLRKQPSSNNPLSNNILTRCIKGKLQQGSLNFAPTKWYLLQQIGATFGGKVKTVKMQKVVKLRNGLS